MREEIEHKKEVVTLAMKAFRKSGIEPIIIPTRGGTDGANLTHAGLPCPNIGIGANNFHSVDEYAVLEDMEKVVEILISIVKEYYLTYKTNNLNSSNKILKTKNPM